MTLRNQLKTLVCVLVAGTATIAGAAITAIGEVAPDPATIGPGDELVIGGSGVGEVIIDGGSVLQNRNTMLGQTMSGAGTMLVDGAGSEWITDYVWLGDEGLGEIEVRNGASVQYGGIEVGGEPDGFGSVLLTGNNSSLQGWDIWIGSPGTGEVTVEGGATASTKYWTYVGFEAGSHGSMAVQGAGSRWDASEGMIVGFDGDGELVVRDGGVVTSADASVGGYRTGSGIATITGAGSRWENTKSTYSTFYVGASTSGSSNILEGAVVTSKWLQIGPTYPIDQEFGDGEMLVDGAGSTLVVSEDLTLGYADAALLTIRNEGVVTVGGRLALSGGTILLDGGTLNNSGGAGVFVDDGVIGGDGVLLGDLTNASTVSPGSSVGLLEVAGNFTQVNGGRLLVELGGTDNADPATPEFDVLSVDEVAALAGNLELSLIPSFAPDPSDTFTILTAGSLTGTFDNVADGERLSIVGGGTGSFRVDYSGTTVVLSDFQGMGGELTGDFNSDGSVDAADYTVWRDSLGATGLAPNELGDGTGDGNVTQEDFDVWRSQFGTTFEVAVGSSSQQAPEPSGLASLLWLGSIAMGARAGTYLKQPVSGS